ncbi:MAG: nicotinamide mononucleotide transporter [Bacilli bacterium]|nr:nicotinamide mononucleotide transporter [Bacilli bacterium]
MNNNKAIITTILIIVFSFILGIISNDLYYGFIALLSGTLNIWLQANGKSSNYIFGCIFNLCNAYISYINNLYGLFFLSLVLYLPLNIYGFFSWNKSKKDDFEITFRKYNRSKSYKIIILSILFSFIFGLLLGIIPSQKLELLDSSSNILNISGMILLNKRLNEGWYILLFNNIIDLIIWIINFINNGPNSFMMLMVSIFYLLINIYGIYKWKNASIIK